MQKLCLLVKLFLVCCAYLPQAWAAPVNDISDPPAYLVPTGSELASINLFLGSIPAIPAGSIFTGLRDTPSTQINTGLDALAPSQLPQAQHMEVGTLPLPTPSHDCPASTPVTITISDSTVVMTDRTFPAFAGFGIGTTILDSRNPSVAAAGIPVFSHLQMAFLLFFVAVSGLLFFRRIETVRS